MGQAVDGWLSADAYHPLPTCEQAAPLPARHRREMLRFAAVAAASSTFFLAVATARTPARIAHAESMSSEMLVAYRVPLWTSVSLVPAIPAPVADVRFAALRRPKPLAMLSARPLPSTAQMIVVAPPVSAAARTPSRFSRLLLGDGQQKVHPFPTLRTRANP